MNLYLVRHGEPKSEQEDPQRPLSKQGISEIRKLSAYVAEQFDLHIQRIMHSPKLRARQTAEILSNDLHPHPKLEEVSGLKPMDDPHIWADQLSKMKVDVMLVGHLPHLSELALLLLDSDTKSDHTGFTTGEMVCLQRNESGTWSFQWSMKPDDAD